MLSYLSDWLQIILRFLHIITGIAWIGASFYFVWLDNHLQKPQSKDLSDKGVDGELWAVHGGGFYNPQKYLIAPKMLPDNLHWFYWESYSTWLSGFALYIVVYLLNAKTMLIDLRVAQISESVAIVSSLGILVAGWLLYDFVCKRWHKNERIVGLLTLLIVAFISWLTCHLFAPRAAFLITGATMATAMSANVFFWIIPGQRAVIKSMRAGETPDPIHGQRGKQRSVHNTYFTLPVIFAMLSNHFHMIYSANYQWVLLIMIMLAAAFIRHYFVMRHKNKNKWGYLVAAATILASMILHLAPSPRAQASAGAEAPQRQVSTAEIMPIIAKRCAPCHAEAPTMMSIAPKNLKLETTESVEANANNIYTQVVVQKVMPLGNVTELTSEERHEIDLWFLSLSRLESRP
jgi:uncharacterized membrane protein